MNKKMLISGVTGMTLCAGIIGYGVFNSNENPTTTTVRMPRNKSRLLNLLCKTQRKTERKYKM